MSKLLDTILLFALPASGKSEVREYMDSLSPEQCIKEFHMGQTIQLDDYYYVHFMHRIDDELSKLGHPYLFYKGPNRPFKNSYEWGTLVHLINKDYDDLIEGRFYGTGSSANFVFDRIDDARAKVNLPRIMGELPYRIRTELASIMYDECTEYIENKNKEGSKYIKDRKDKTIIIECARGGANGSAFPITPPRGYMYAFTQFSEQILNRSSILYVWVTPEDSRRKNIERALPNEQGSILHHSVPMEVMLAEYGCDDIEYLISQSDVPDTIKVERIIESPKNGPFGEHGTTRYHVKKWYLPVVRFDNRADLTTFIRKYKTEWGKDEIAAIHAELSKACNTLASKL